LSAGIGRSIAKRVLIVTAATALIAGGTGSLIAANAGGVGGRGAPNGAQGQGDKGDKGDKGQGKVNKGEGTFKLCSAGDFESFAKFDYGQDINVGQGKGGPGKGKDKEGQGKGKEDPGAKGKGKEGRESKGIKEGGAQGGANKGGANKGGANKGQQKQKLAQDSGIVPEGKCVNQNIVGLGKGSKAELYTVDAEGTKVDVGSAPFVNNKLEIIMMGTAEAPTIIDMTGGKIKPVKKAAADDDD